MSKTFTGTVSFDFKLVLSDESVAAVMQHIQEVVTSQEELSAFQRFIVGRENDDARIAALWRKGMRDQFKAYLQGVHDDTVSAGHGDSFKFSPITVKVEGKA